LSIRQFKYKKFAKRKFFIGYSKKNKSANNTIDISGVVRNTRLLRALSSIRRYLIPQHYYQIRYSYLLNNFYSKSYKHGSAKFKGVKRRFLFSKGKSLIAGNVQLFRYKTWILFL
jgi:hypothetical protein